MTLYLAQPIDTSDDLLMSDDERAAFLTPIPLPNLDAFRNPIGETPAGILYAADVRQAARQRRDARLRESALARTQREAA